MIRNDRTLERLSEAAMRARDFLTQFPPAVVEELARLEQPAAPNPLTAYRDLRKLLWVSIDNDDSRDLDQLTFAETTSDHLHKIYIAVADVDALVHPDSAIDRYASHNTTSVYTPTRVFSMLPEKLSTDLTSLNENEDRCAIVIEMLVNSEGQCSDHEVYLALVHNHAKLAYNGISAHLEERAPLPEKVAHIPDLSQQLFLQHAIAQRLQSHRDSQGALYFASIQLKPVIAEGRAIHLEQKPHQSADSLIENFMIAANVAVIQFCEEHRLPALRRVVRIPERWDRIVALAKHHHYRLPPEPDSRALQSFLIQMRASQPEHFVDLSLAVIKLVGKGEYIAEIPGTLPPGHFDLALPEYSHATAPNRRYPDLIVQRILKSQLLSKHAPYSDDALVSIALNCTKKEDDAKKVERQLGKSAAAMVLSTELGRLFPAMVTGASAKGTWVRLKAPPVEGKLIEGFHGLDIGDKVTVKLVSVDIAKGYLDFVLADRS